MVHAYEMKVVRRHPQEAFSVITVHAKDEKQGYTIASAFVRQKACYDREWYGEGNSRILSPE